MAIKRIRLRCLRCLALRRSVRLGRLDFAVMGVRSFMVVTGKNNILRQKMGKGRPVSRCPPLNRSVMNIGKMLEIQ